MTDDHATQMNAELTNVITLTTHIVGMSYVTNKNAKLFWFRNILSCRMHDTEPGFTYMDLLTHLPLNTHAKDLSDDDFLANTLLQVTEKLSYKIGCDNPYYTEED
jgi:hypothetical protein